MLRIMTSEGFDTPPFPILHTLQSHLFLIGNKHPGSVLSAEK